MSSENRKQGLFERLNANRKPKKSCCCGSVEVEEIPDESSATPDGGKGSTDKEKPSDNSSSKGRQ